jgi:4-amino-4-deoxy-L-arabinose transferase-like glycosyltransferase
MEAMNRETEGCAAANDAILMSHSTVLDKPVNDCSLLGSAGPVRSALFRPGQTASERFIVLALLLLSFSYLCLFRRFTAMEPDEGILLQGAQRILAGQVLYRDFFSFYTPGSYYALALLFKIFGSSLPVARTALALAGAILSSITYLLARRVCSQAIALTLAALATLTTLPYRFLVLHNWDSTLWACLALYCAVSLLEMPSRKWAFALGLFASLTVLFEQSKGAGLCLGLGMGFLAIWFLQGRKRLLKQAELLALVIGFAGPIAIAFAYFASQHAASTMLADWLWPLHHYSRANRVPYGYQNWSDDARHELFGTGSLPERVIKVLAISPCFWIPVLPLIAVGLLAYWIVQARHNSAADEKSAYYVIMAAGFAGISLSTVVVRADIIHFMYLQPLNCLVLAWLLDGRDIPGRLIRSARPLLTAYVMIALGMFGLAPLLGARAAHNQVATRRGVVTTGRKDTVIDYVQAHVPAGETIFVYPYLPLYYYLTGTFSPGRYDYFQPGMHTREQAEEIVRELATGRVRVVLFETNFLDKVSNSWPGTPLKAIAADPVADYIARNYRACRVLTSPAEWRFLFMVRKELVCPNVETK